MPRIIAFLLAALGVVMVIAKLGMVIFLAGARWLYVNWTLRRWDRALKSLGFATNTKNRLIDYQLHGGNGRFEIRVKRGFRFGWPPFVNTVTLRGGGLPDTLTARAAKRSFFSLFSEPQPELGEVVTGDSQFDESVVLHGDPQEALAHLDAEARRSVRRLLAQSGAYVGAAEIGFEGPKTDSDPQTLRRLVTDLVSAGEVLSNDGRPRPETLAHNAISDPVGAVRLRNLRALLAAFPESPDARRAAQQAMGTTDHYARFEGARFLGNDGVPCMVALVGDALAVVSLRTQALSWLLSERTPQQAAPALEAALRSGHEQLERAAIKAVADLRYGGLTPAIGDLADGCNAETAVLIAETLGLLGGTAVEQVLVALLRRRDNTVRIACAQALSKVGSVLAVEPLLPLTEGLFTSGDVKEAAKDAVEKIRARIGPADHGRLSLVEGDDDRGALTLAHNGELSLADD